MRHTPYISIFNKGVDFILFPQNCKINFSKTKTQKNIRELNVAAIFETQETQDTRAKVVERKFDLLLVIPALKLMIGNLCKNLEKMDEGATKLQHNHATTRKLAIILIL